jgi:membrane protein DedA with SNARE-associated domain
MDPLHTWMLLFVGATVGACLGYFIGAIFTRAAIREEQAEADWQARFDAVWLNELTHRAKE